jgi:hypothetical protein
VYTVSTFVEAVLVAMLGAGFLAIPTPRVPPTMIAMMIEATARSTRAVIHLALFVMHERLKDRASMPPGKWG